MASILSKAELHRAGDIVGKDVTRTARPWPDQPLISFPTMLGLRFYQNSPHNVGQIGSFGENIKFSAIPDEATNYRCILSNFKSTILLPLSFNIVFMSRHWKCFDLWRSFRKRPFWFSKFI